MGNEMGMVFAVIATAMASSLAAADMPRVLRLPAETVTRGSSFSPYATRRARREFEPGDAAPALTLQTLGGGTVQMGDIQPAVFNVLHRESLFSRALWGLPESIDSLLHSLGQQAGARDDTHFVFASWAANATDAAGAAEDVAALRELFVARNASRAFLARAHFVTTPAAALGEGGWVGNLLQQWPTTMDQMGVESTRATTSTTATANNP